MSRIERWKRLAEEAKRAAEMAALAQEPRSEVDAKWRRYNHYARKIYNYQQKRWYAQARKDLKEAHPYGAFYAIPKMMFNMLQRCNEYWQGGYNVWATDEYADPIREQVAHAWQLALECLDYWMNSDCDEFPQDKMEELFSYVAQHLIYWSD